MDILISHTVGARRSFEFSSTSRERISCSPCVVVEAVRMEVLDTRIAVVAHGRDRNASFQCKGDPGV